MPVSFSRSGAAFVQRGPLKASSKLLKPPTSTHPPILRSLPLSLPGIATDMKPTRTTSVTGIRRKVVLVANSHKKTTETSKNRVTSYPCQRHQAPWMKMYCQFWQIWITFHNLQAERCSPVAQRTAEQPEQPCADASTTYQSLAN